MKELAKVIADVIAAASAAGEVNALSFEIAAPVPEGYYGNIRIELVQGRAVSIGGTVAPSEVATGEPEKPKRTRKVKEEPATEITVVGWDKQPLEVVAALLALYGAKKQYSDEEIAAAGDLLASGSHGNVEEHAGQILAVLQANSNPKLLNDAAVRIMGQVLEWWDDLEDHSAFFALLKDTTSDKREAIEPVIYWKGEDQSGKFEGKGQLAAYREKAEQMELEGEAFEQTTEKEYRRLNAAKADTPEIDITALKAEGLGLVRAKASAHRDGIEAVLKEHGAINADTGKASWGFIPDANVQAAVEALKAL